MLEKIKERVKAWKRLYAQDCQKCDENSSWYDILMELEYYRHDKFYVSGRRKLWEAVRTIGVFSSEERQYLEMLPAYALISRYLKYDYSRENFACLIDCHEVFSMYSAKENRIPFREYTIVTDRQDLWGLEMYIFRDSPDFGCQQHGIIRYAKERPADYVEPEYADDDLPF